MQIFCTTIAPNVNKVSEHFHVGLRTSSSYRFAKGDSDFSGCCHNTYMLQIAFRTLDGSRCHSTVTLSEPFLRTCCVPKISSLNNKTAHSFSFLYALTPSQSAKSIRRSIEVGNFDFELMVLIIVGFSCYYLKHLHRYYLENRNKKIENNSCS